MTKEIVFWVLMLIWLVFGCWENRAEWKTGRYHAFGGNLLMFALLAVLGWQTFGPPIK